jgi:hypothetical protein
VQKLNLPSFQFRFKKDDQKRPCIFDSIRRKWLVFTPEEWVRQNWVRFVVEFLNYPEGIIQIESGLKVNQNQRRSDVLIYKDSKATVLIECKAPKIKITDSTLSQALNYNLVYKVKYIVLTNGLEHTVFSIIEGEIKQLAELPKFECL